MSYIVVAYFTENTGYEQEIKHLEKSLLHFNLPMDLVGITSQGNWKANTQYKPYFLKQMLMRHYPKNLLYLDADARVQQFPTLFDHFPFDLGVVYWKEQLLAGTLYLANNAKVYEILERWISYSFENPTVWDQRVLQYVLQVSQDLDLKLSYLPPTYCQIFDFMKEEGQPVIEQFQASRRFKTLMNDKP